MRAVVTTPILAAFVFACTPAAQPAPYDPSGTGSSSEGLEEEPTGAGAEPGAPTEGLPSSSGTSASKAPCGGLGAAKCPSGSTCIDDPSDACDPKNGGADCGGICVAAACSASKPCASGYKCGDKGTCLEVTIATCGGLELKSCPGGTRCVDDATDGCDPKTGGVSCPGVCMPE